MATSWAIRHHRYCDPEAHDRQPARLVLLTDRFLFNIGITDRGGRAA